MKQRNTLFKIVFTSVFLIALFSLSSVAYAVTGEVQFSISPAYQIGTAGSYAGNGNTIAKLFDGSFLTNWDAPNPSGDFAGVDTTVASKLTRVRIAPRVSYTYRTPGATILGSNVSSSTGPWTTLLTIPSSPYAPEKQYTEYAINTGSSTYRYYAVRSAPSNYGSLGEVRFFGVPTSTVPFLPVTPTASPAGGQYQKAINVTLSGLTTDAVIYYTNDGTTPSYSGGVPQGTTQLYSGAFLISSTGTTTIKTIAVSTSTSAVSEVSDPYYFHINSSYVPGANWNDTTNNQIDAYNGSVSFLNGRYYWYGESLNNSGTENEFVGINAYSSTDLMNWKKEGTVINTVSYKMRKPHVIYNATTSTYVMWGRNVASQRVVIATSSSPIGPFNVVTNSYVADGAGVNDVSLFKDTDGSAYAVYTKVDNTAINITKLSNDYLSVSTSTTFITPPTLAGREAPAMFKRGSVYFILSSAINGYTPTTNKYATSSSPMGTWSALVNPFQTSGAEDNTLAYHSQTSDVLTITGRTDGYVYVGDRYDGTNTVNSRAVWLPITFPTAGTMSISYQSSWELDSTFTSVGTPAAASNISVTKSGLQANVSWTNNETNGYTLFVDKAADAAFTSGFKSTLVGSASTTFSDTDIINGNTYYYRVRTVTGAGTTNSPSAIGNFSLAADVTPPTATVTVPAPSALLIGHSVTLSATSTDDISVSSVQFYVDGNAVGAAGVTPNYSITWDSATVADGSHTIIAVAKDPSGNAGTSSPVTVTVGNSLVTFSMSTSTVMQNSIGNTITLTGVNTSWTAGTPGSPTFVLSGGTGASITSQSVSSSSSATVTVSAGSGISTLIIQDPGSPASSTLTVLADTVPPTVTLTSPAASSTLVGTTVTLTATSSDNVRVTSVQFRIDNTNIGASGTSSPYSIVWNSTTVPDGTHTLVAIATDATGNVSTSSPVSVIVNNSTYPTVTTASSTSISAFTVTLNGNITNDGGASSTARGFLYGLTTTYTGTTTETGTFGAGAFSTSTVYFACDTTYHYKAYARNLSGTAYGSDQVFTTATCPTATATGEIQFSTDLAYQFGVTPSYLNLGNNPYRAFDNDTSTWWDTYNSNGAYIGLDLKVPARATRFIIAPRQGFTARVFGARFQGAASTTGTWTDIYTISTSTSARYYPQRQTSEIQVDTGGASYRYYRLLMADGTNGSLAEFRVIGLPGTTTPYVPVIPKITPGGGRFANPMKVRISSLTTDATLYYTTDGSTPVFASGSPQGTTQLYTGPFVVTNTSSTTVKAIAVSGTLVSDVSDPALFAINSNFNPAGDWLDSTGHLIESHDGAVMYFNGRYYWYGQIFNANDPEVESVGVSCYSSADLVNWKEETPSIYMGRAYKVERPHVIYNDTTHKYVMWGHTILNESVSRQDRGLIAYADTPIGPFTVATTTYMADALGVGDMNLFKDTDGTAYLTYSDGSNQNFYISRLSADYLSVSGVNIIPSVFHLHEGPQMFLRNGVYYLMSSQLTGWAPNLNTYATSTSPMGTWSALRNPFVASLEQDASTSYQSQTTQILQVRGRSDAWIYIGDRFEYSNVQGGSLYNSRHIWLPMVFQTATSTNYTIPWQSSWNLDTAFPTITTPTLAATGFSVNKTGSTVTMSWTNNETNSYDLYVDRATDIGFTQNVVADLVATSTTSYTDTVNAGLNYYYRIRTVSAASTSNSPTLYTGGALPTFSVDVSSMAASTTGNVIHLTGNGTSWTPGTPGSPAFTASGVAGVSITSQVIASSTYATLTLTTGNATGTVTITDPSTTSTATTSVVGDTVAPVISNVATSSISTSTATISWTTNEVSDTQVFYGTTISYGASSTLNLTATTSHTAVLTGLTPNTLYHYQVRSADPSSNLATSSDQTFTTNALAVSRPTLTQQSATSVSTSTVTLNATITSDGNGSSTSRGFNYGTTLSYGSVASTTGTYGVGAFALSLSGLTPNTLYHAQAFTVNGAGTGTSSDVTFTTNAISAPAISNIASSTTQTTATISWSTDVAASSTVQYGLTSSYTSASSSQALVFTRSIVLTGLTPATTYHFQVGGANSFGVVGTSSDLVFTTSALPVTVPTLTQQSATSVSTSTVTLNATITSDGNGSSTSRGFNYGTTLSYGSVASTTGTYGVGAFALSLSGLTPNTLYHAQAFTVNGAGTGTSSDVTFTTGAVLDTTPPSVSIITPTTGSTLSGTTTLTATAADNIGVANVQFYVDGVARGSAVTTSPYTVSWNTASVSDTSHTISAVARDSSGNQATTTITVTTDNTGPSISSVSSGTPGVSTTTITWNTTIEASDSLVEYGPTSTYISSSTYNASLVNIHTVNLTSLSPSTLYHYRVISVDALGNRTNGSDLTFTTQAGPDVTAPVISTVASSTGTSTATISWTTNEPADTQIFYGVTTGYGTQTLLDSTATTSHTVIISGLTPATTYHFQIRTQDVAGNLATSSDRIFTTSLLPTYAITPDVSSVFVNSTSTVTLTGLNTTWTSGTPGAPTFTVSGVAGASIFAQSVLSNTSATLTLTTGNATGTLVVTDPSTQSTTTVSVVVVPPPPAVSISSVDVTPSSSGIALAWTTNVGATSRVFYGLESGVYTQSTTKTDTGAGVTSHAVNITGLSSCTPYRYIAVSENATSTTVATSSEGYVVTTGCTNNSVAVSTSTVVAVQTSTGATTTSTSLAGTTITVVVPPGFTSTSSSASFVVQDLNVATFFAGVNVPSGATRVGSTIVNLTAHTDVSTILPTFDQPISITMSYTPTDIQNINESSLMIYRYDTGTWTPLSNCIVNSTAKTVTCQTTHFSDFGLFGTYIAPVASQQNNGGGGGGGGGGGDATGIIYYNRPVVTSTKTTQTQYNLIPASVIFTRSLSLNMTGADVKALQQFLNNNGFTIAKTGTGSRGKETTKFAAATKKAVILFQNTYADAILKPVGLKTGNGTVGKATYTFINQLRQPVVKSMATTTASSTLTVPLEVLKKLTLNLSFGDKNEEVKTLQKFLAKFPALYPEGTINGYFGPATKNALIKFQKTNGIKPADGILGPATRKKINALL